MTIFGPDYIPGTSYTTACSSNSQGESPTYILGEDTHPEHTRSEYHTQLAKMSFDKIFDITAGVHLNFYIIKTK